MAEWRTRSWLTVIVQKIKKSHCCEDINYRCTPLWRSFLLNSKYWFICFFFWVGEGVQTTFSTNIKLFIFSSSREANAFLNSIWTRLPSQWRPSDLILMWMWQIYFSNPFFDTTVKLSRQFPGLCSQLKSREHTVLIKPWHACHRSHTLVTN